MNYKSIFTHVALIVICILAMSYVTDQLMRSLFFIGLWITLVSFLTKTPVMIAKAVFGPKTTDASEPTVESGGESPSGLKMPCKSCEANAPSFPANCSNCQTVTDAPDVPTADKNEKPAGPKSPCLFCEAVTGSSSTYCDHCSREVEGCTDCGSCKICGRESV